MAYFHLRQLIIIMVIDSGWSVKVAIITLIKPIKPIVLIVPIKPTGQVIIVAFFMALVNPKLKKN